MNGPPPPLLVAILGQSIEQADETEDRQLRENYLHGGSSAIRIGPRMIRLVPSFLRHRASDG